MMASGDIESLNQQLIQYNQLHLIQFWDQLNDIERQQLYSELSHLDLNYITQCFQSCCDELNTVATSIDDQLEPLPSSVVGSVVRTDSKTLQEYEDIGRHAWK